MNWSYLKIFISLWKLIISLPTYDCCFQLFHYPGNISTKIRKREEADFWNIYYNLHSFSSVWMFLITWLIWATSCLVLFHIIIKLHFLNQWLWFTNWNNQRINCQPSKLLWSSNPKKVHKRRKSWLCPNWILRYLLKQMSVKKTVSRWRNWMFVAKYQSSFYWIGLENKWYYINTPNLEINWIMWRLLWKTRFFISLEMIFFIIISFSEVYEPIEEFF